ncbi:MAG: type I-B CRISPR-associated protein Cas7/Cst2/DevR [Hydrogenobacter sp.]
MKGLTLTVITHRATGGLNYGETFGNVSTLKKLTLGDNTQLVYISDKALRYSIRMWLKENKNWRLLDGLVANLVNGNLKEKETLDVDSFAKQLIEMYQEFDLFGGLFTNLKTSEGKKAKLSTGDSIKRTSVAKFTYAFALNPYKGDADFLNNIDAFNRYIKYVEDKGEQAIAYTEQHTSHYVYTLTVDLNRIGVWEKEDGSVEDVLPPQEKVKRVRDLLDAIFNLSRGIRARHENLGPIFLIGGIFHTKNPFFVDCIDVKEEEGKLYLNIRKLLDCVALVPEKDNVICGMLSGFFANEEEIRKNLNCRSMAEVLESFKKAVRYSYGSSEV